MEENNDQTEETPPSLISKNSEQRTDKENTIRNLVEPQDRQEVEFEYNVWLNRRQILIEKAWREVMCKSNNLFISPWSTETSKSFILANSYNPLNDPICRHLQYKYIQILITESTPSADLEILTNILKFGRMMPILDIMSEFNKRTGTITNIDYVVEYLVQVGILLRGNWIVRSEFLYEAGTVSRVNQIPAESMCIARDYLIYKYSLLDSASLSKVDIDFQVFQLPREELVEILISIANLDSNMQWALVRPLETCFEYRYPAVVQFQAMIWRCAMKEPLYDAMDSYSQTDTDNGSCNLLSASLNKNEN